MFNLNQSVHYTCWSCHKQISDVRCPFCQQLQTGEQLNYFQLLNLEPGLDIDSQKLQQRFSELQYYVHPDRIKNFKTQQRLNALKLSQRLNLAYQQLKDPLLHAEYLYYLINEQQKTSVGKQSTNKQPSASYQLDADFLMQIMDYQESIDHCKKVQGLLDLKHEIDQLMQQNWRQIKLAFTQNQVTVFTEYLHRIKYNDRLQQAITNKIALLHVSENNKE